MDIHDMDTTEVPIQPDGEPSAPQQVQVAVCGRSHMGKVRSNNEDQFFVARVARSLETVVSSLPSDEVPAHADTVGYIMVVADGMGGAVAGEVASGTAVNTLVKVLLDVPDWVMRLDDAGFAEVSKRAAQYYDKVNEELSRRVQEEPELSGMGTTMTVAYSLGTGLFIAHVGDSRAYLLRRGKMRQLTRDHTQAQALVEAGVLSREQVTTHRLRHVLTNALGVSDRPVDVEVHNVDLRDGDRLLLCTDGLTEMLSDAEIERALGDGRPPGETCQTLVDLAVEAGGRDNVTVVAAHYSVSARSAS